MLFRRLSFEGEVTVIGPLAVELKPSWIWDSPERALDASGFAIAADIVLYIEEEPMNGFWLKAHAGYETFEATLNHVSGATQTKGVSSPVFGALIGGSTVISPKKGGGGFILSGGIGFGVATADPVTLSVEGLDASLQQFTRAEYTFYGDWRRLSLLSTLALGVAF